MYFVARVYKVGQVMNNAEEKKYILWTDINQYENIEPALQMRDYYNSVFGFPITPAEKYDIPQYLKINSGGTYIENTSINRQVMLGYVVYDTRRQLYAVKAQLNASNVGENSKKVYDSTIYYNNVPFEVAQLAVDYYNNFETFRETPPDTIFKYVYFPMRHIFS